MGYFKRFLIEMLEEGELVEVNGPEFDPPENEVPKELLDAENRCPNVKFVKSCREFFDRRGFLSEKQRRALMFSGTPNRRYNYFYGFDPEY